MFITAIELETAALSQQLAFYTQALGLPLRQSTADSFTVQAGTTALTFRSASQLSLLYHFAFTIPINKWKQARTWLSARATLLKGEEEDEFAGERIRARSYYFLDAAGNILEFIARQDLPDRPGEDFGAEDVLNVGEMGLVVDDVPAIMQQLYTRPGVEVFRDSSSERFAQIGDINGVLVLAKRGRMWFPEERQPAVVSPARVSILGTLADQISLDPYPYMLEVIPLNI